MNENTTHSDVAPRFDPVFTDSYYDSTMELRHGTIVNEVSLGHLRNEEVIELLRMRGLWQSH